MNKKFSTLMAMALMASSVNGWATVIQKGATTTDGYIYQAATVGAEISSVVKDEASHVGKAEFPIVSPFAIDPVYGAKPISYLQYVDGKSDGRYFQFVVGHSYKTDKSGDLQHGDGTEVLTMVWDAEANTVTGKGAYKVQIENVKNANYSGNQITLDRTLWKVTAHKDAVGGTTLYYELQNKASQAILQLSRDNVVEGASGANGEQEIELTIVNGQTNWRWAQGQIASQESEITFGSGWTGDKIVLRDQLSAQYDNGTTIYLAKKVKNSATGEVTLGAIKMNSNQPFSTRGVVIGDYTYYPISFEGWEANPIVLTAAQINAELGNENQLTEDKQTKNYFHFEFENDVQGDENLMTKYDFTAEPCVSDGYSRFPGDAPDGYVRFLKKGSTDEYLRVDTVYYDPSANAQYALKMAVSSIDLPRGAVQADGKTMGSNGKLSGVSDKDFYTGAYATNAYTAKSYVQLMRQSNFRPIFYPATQSLRLQAEMIYRADKNNSAPWWQQMAEDASYDTSAPDATSRTGKAMRIASYAYEPAGVNLVNNPGAARGYYPSYTQFIGNTGTIEQGARLIHYVNSWLEPDAARTKFNGYAPQGGYEAYNLTNKTANKMIWNAVGNLFLGSSALAPAHVDNDGWKQNIDFGGSGGSSTNVWVVDPASTATSGTGTYINTGCAANNVVVSGTNSAKLVTAPQFALAHSNLVRLTTLTQGHRVLTADVHDMNDTEFNGLNTFITLKVVKEEGGLEEIANIEEAFYYIQNAKQMNSDLVAPNAYRYEDLAATNATFNYWNSDTQAWDRGYSNTVDGTGAKTTAGYLYETTGYDNDGLNTAYHEDDNANIGNLVYSTDKKVIPSAQWYIKGNGGYYTIINRESGRAWGTSYWWKVQGQDDVYANMATYTDGSGLQQTYRDTIRISKVPASELNKPFMGYLDFTTEEAVADTSNYSVGMTMAGVSFSLTEGANGVLQLTQEEGEKGLYKLERVLVTDKDLYSQREVKTDTLRYGYLPIINGEGAYPLYRAKYYIYKDEVNANSGIEESSIQTRKYITLNAGQYQLTSIKVESLENGFYANTEVDEIANTEGVKVRRAFYIKQISTDEPNQYVLVDPMVVTQTQNGTSTKTAYGARLFSDQFSTVIKPSSLISDGYSNAYAASIFNIDHQQAFNYADIRPAGVARDTVEFYSAKTDGQYLLSENCNVAGAHVGLFESLDKLMNKNNAMFLDTANVAYPECPRFLIGLRSEDVKEKSNIDGHNRHLYTDADYLVNMIDSAKTNTAYVYKNQSFNETPYYRLGFIRARHYGDVRFGEEGKPSTLKFLKSSKEYDYDLAALGNDKLNIATFAFRYPNANRDLEEGVYIETMYDHKTRGWLKTINHILVVTNDIQEADLFKINTETTDVPTANEEIAASSVVVAGANGAVVVKGAEGKSVIVSTILGKVVANEVLTSDNAQIAAPAGVVVVSVDGESFKVVVK